jgi:hypothetical protein
MVGCFGLCDDHCHTRVPLDRLIESRARLDATMHRPLSTEMISLDTKRR